MLHRGGGEKGLDDSERDIKGGTKTQLVQFKHIKIIWIFRIFKKSWYTPGIRNLQ